MRHIKGLKCTLLISVLLFSPLSMAYYWAPALPSLSISESRSSDGTWRLNWSNSSGATTYILEEFIAAGSSRSGWGKVYVGSKRSKTIGGKRLNGKYYYRIRACRKYVCSKYSTSKAVSLTYIYRSTLRGLPKKSRSGNFRLHWSIPRHQTAQLQRLLPNQKYYSNATGIGRRTSLYQRGVLPSKYQYRLKRYLTFRSKYRAVIGKSCKKRWYRWKKRWRCKYKYGYKYRYHKIPYIEASKKVSVLTPMTPYFRYVPATSTGMSRIIWQRIYYSNSYQLQYSKDGGGYTTVHSSSSTSKTVRMLPGNYKFRVRACRGNKYRSKVYYSNHHCSGWRYSKNTKVIMAKPRRPSISGKNNLSDTSFKLSWDWVRNADNYRVYRERAFFGGRKYKGELIYKGKYRSIPQKFTGDGYFKYRVSACYKSICGKYSDFRFTSVLGVPEKPKRPRIEDRYGLTDSAYSIHWDEQKRRVSNYKLYIEKATYGSNSYGKKTFLKQTRSTKYDHKNISDGHYRYSVKACNEAGCSALSSTVTTSVLARPSMPKGLKIIDKSSLADSTYRLQWTAQANRITHYDLARSKAAYGDNYGTETTIKFTKKSTDQFKDIAGHYRYRVRACNEGGCSAYTEYTKTSVLAVPNTPSGVLIFNKANQADDTYGLQWDKQNKRVTHYMVYSSRAEIAGSFGKETSQKTDQKELIFNNLDGDYRYRVKACNEAGCSSASGYIKTRVLALPATPSNLSIKDLKTREDGSFDYRVQWNDQVRRVTKYQLYLSKADYQTNSSTLISYGKENLISENKLISLLQNNPDGHYRYRVAACNETGCSAKSDYKFANLLALPKIPKAVQVPEQTLGAFTASIIFSDGLIQSVKLQQSINKGEWHDAPINSYSGKPTQIKLTRRAYIDNSSSVLANYRFRVAACNNSGCSDFSSPSRTVAVLPPGTPAAFVAVTSHGNQLTNTTFDSDGDYHLQWKKINDIKSLGNLFEIHYELQRSIDSGETWQILNLKDNRKPHFEVKDQNEGDYSYRLRACLEQIGCGDWTHTIIAKVGFPPQAISQVTIPAISTTGSLKISWTKPSGTSSHYQLEINGKLDSTAITGLSHTVTDLQDATYSYRLRACNNVVCSPWTSVSSSEVLQTPSVPQSLQGDTKSNGLGEFWISWSKPKSGQVTEYQLKTSDIPHNSWSNAINTDTAVEQSFIKSDGQYSYSVRACNRFADASLNCGPATDLHTVEVIKIPVTPTPITLPSFSINGTYTLNWKKPSGSVSHYQLLEDGFVIADNISATSYDIQNNPDGDYSYQLRACNSNGCSTRNTAVSIQILRTPENIRHFNGYMTSTSQDGSLTLGWQAPRGGTVSYYQLRRTHGEVVNWEVKDTGQLWFEQTLGYKAIEGDHYYWLRACNSLSCGNEAEYILKIRLKPTSPTSIKGKGINSDGQYRLSWLAGIGTITDYQLEEREQDSQYWRTVTSTEKLYYEFSDQSAGNYEYRLRACNDGTCGDWSEIKTVEVNRFSVPTPPAIQTASDPGVPYGSDNIGSIAGQFRVSEGGAATYNVPITVAAGTAGVSPQISLAYSSQGGNGIVGKGWNLNGLSAIVRCRQTIMQDGKAMPISWNANDRFCLDGQRLVVTQGNYGAPYSQYKTEVDSYSNITAYGGSGGHPSYFKVEGKDGSVTFYGKTTSSKQTTKQGKTFNWAISRFEDSVGNGIDYDYHNDSQGHRIAQINYAYGNSNSANASIKFAYQNRADVIHSYISGHSFKIAKRLSGIKTYSRHHGSNVLLRDYRIKYAATVETAPSIAQSSKLISLTECTRDGSCLPVTKFKWQYANSRFAIHNDGEVKIKMDKVNYLLDTKYTDINGDGLKDLIYVSSYAKTKKRLLRKAKVRSHQNVHTLINTGTGFVNLTTTKYTDKIDHPLEPHVVDYNADGHLDMLLYSESHKWELYLSVSYGAGFWSLERKTGIHFPFTGSEIEFADLNSDGLVDAFNGKHYWLLERDPSKSADSNLAYRFSTGRSIQCIGCGDRLKVNAPAGDINGDGIVDFLISKVDRRGNYGQEIYGNHLIASNFNNNKLHYSLVKLKNSTEDSAIGDQDLFYSVDINSDGLSDIIYWNLAKHRWQLQLSTGADFTNAVGLIPAYSDPYEHGYSNIAEKQRVQLADLNRDGHPDLIWQQDEKLKIRYWSNSQQKFIATRNLRNIEKNEETSHIFMDYNGDAVTDYIRFKGHKKGHGGVFSLYSSGDKADEIWDAERNISDVITQIKNGLGAVTELNYQRINQSDHYKPLAPAVSVCEWNEQCNYKNSNRVFNDPFGDLPNSAQSLQSNPVSPVLSINGPLSIVSRVSSSAPVPDNPDAQSHISYYYAAARMQAAGRGSLGFKELRTVDEQTGVKTTTVYRQDWPFIGSPWKTRVETAQGNLLRQSTNQWALQGWQSHWPNSFKNTGSAKLKALKPYIASTEERQYSLENNGNSQGDLITIISTQTDYDGYGNATKIVTETRNGNNAMIGRQTTSNSYGSSNYDRQKGRLSHTKVVAERPGQKSKTKQSSFSYFSGGPHQGLLRTEIIQSNSGQSQKLHSTHSYDSHGNRTRTVTSGWDGQSTIKRYSVRAEYDSSGRYIAKSYQQYPKIGERLISRVISRNAYGKPTVVEDSLGNRAYSYFSARGRQYFSRSDAGGWQKTWLDNYSSRCPAGTAYVAHSLNADGSATQQCNDRVGRPQRKLTKGFDGGWIASDIEYDKLGRTQRSSKPFEMNYGGAYGSYWTSVKYDLLGRPIAITAPDGSVSKKQYNGLTTTSINSGFQSKIEKNNALGEIIAVTDNLHSQTQYIYDAQGQMVTMIDNNGNQTHLVYDALGRKISMNDPDKGQWHYSYNAFGELINQTDANGQTSQIYYDSLGRKIQRIDKHKNGSVEQATQWQYDTVANGLGQLAQISNNKGYRLVPHYDHLGRNYQTDTILPDIGKFTERQTFDHLGRIFQRFDAASEQDDNGIRGVQTEYNPHGYISAVTDVRHRNGKPVTTYQRIHQMDARGNILSASSANDFIQTSKSYDYAMGLIKEINSTGYLGDNLQNLQYQWDSLGNLSSRVDNSGDKYLHESFSYDGLNRLISATTDNKHQQVQYDSLGNITYKSDVGSYSYGYGNNSGAGPHAVIEAGGVTYKYDANGNNISSSDGRTLSYSTFDKVLKVNKGSHQVTFAYGPERNRYMRADHDKNTGDSKTTYYIGNVELINYHTGSREGDFEYKRQLGNAVETILYRKGEIHSQQIHYLLYDHLGSIDLIVDKASNIVQQLSFDAWGQRRSGQDWQTVIKDAQNKPMAQTAFSTLNQITTRGYTGHEMVDGVGIIHMNGRIYDAKLARFLQADPFVQEPYNTQSLNRYSYVINNPFNATDPSGYSFIPLLKAFIVSHGVSDIITTIGINSGWDEDLIQGLTIIASFAVRSHSNGGNMNIGKEFFAMSVLGGIGSMLQGGKFGHGFASAFLGSVIGQEVGRFSSGSGITLKDLGKFITKATLSGTVSHVTGGKFANGAAGAAFATVVAVVGAGLGGSQGSQASESKSGVRLGIHSNVESDSDFTAGHAWISVEDAEGNVTNYGLWPDEHPATMDNGAGSDVRVGLEDGQVPVASEYFDLTVDQNAQLDDYLATSAEWGYTHTCADWARDAVKYTTGQRIDVDDWFGFETPRELSRSLGK